MLALLKLSNIWVCVFVKLHNLATYWPLLKDFGRPRLVWNSSQKCATFVCAPAALHHHPSARQHPQTWIMPPKPLTRRSALTEQSHLDCCQAPLHLRNLEEQFASNVIYTETLISSLKRYLAAEYHLRRSATTANYFSLIPRLRVFPDSSNPPFRIASRR